MLFYPAVFEPAEEGGYIAHFPQFGGFTQGETIEETTSMCEDLLVSYIEDYFGMDKPIPLPDQITEDQHAIPLSVLMTAKVLLHNAQLEQGVTNAQLARLMNTSPAEVQRIVNVRHNTKIDTISKALGVLAKRLQLSVV